MTLGTECEKFARTMSPCSANPPAVVGRQKKYRAQSISAGRIDVNANRLEKEYVGDENLATYRSGNNTNNRARRMDYPKTIAQGKKDDKNGMETPIQTELVTEKKMEQKLAVDECQIEHRQEPLFVIVGRT